MTREHCINNERKRIVAKDLGILLSGRDLKDIIIIDNKPSSYLFNFENGIPIKNFMGDKTDKELSLLTNYIKAKLLYAEDVREVIKKDFLDPKFLQDKKREFNIK